MTIKAQLAGVDYVRRTPDQLICYPPRMVARNTVQYYRPNGNLVIRLHQTDIIEYSADKQSVTLRTGGYWTQTTKMRMQRFSSFVVDSGYIDSSGKQHGRPSWYIRHRNKMWYLARPFIDGMTIHNGQLPQEKPQLPGLLNAAIARFVRQEEHRVNNYHYHTDKSEVGFLVAGGRTYRGAYPHPLIDKWLTIAYAAVPYQVSAAIKLGSTHDPIRKRAQKYMQEALKQYFAPVYADARGEPVPAAQLEPFYRQLSFSSFNFSWGEH